jgi:coenzyme PQQ biosynthesis protein C
LTELFAPEIHKQRLANWPEHYPWIDPQGLQYFQSRVSLARRDVEFGLEFTLQHFDTRPLQERAIEILKFKLDVLWQMSDAMALRYMVSPGERASSGARVPPGERASPDERVSDSELALPGERLLPGGRA